MRKIIALVLSLSMMAAAADKPRYRDGTVVKVTTREDAAGGAAPQRPDSAGPGYGAISFIRITAGARTYTAQYIPDGLEDYPAKLHPGQRVRFRLAGQELVLRAPGGREWRTSLVTDWASPAKK